MHSVQGSRTFNNCVEASKVLVLFITVWKIAIATCLGAENQATCLGAENQSLDMQFMQDINYELDINAVDSGH